MFSFIYDIALLLLAIIALPKMVWQCLAQGKYRKSLSSRLGFRIPTLPKDKKVIWIHAVSMGETRAVIPFFRLVRKGFPDALIVISSTTETGHAEAKRSMPEAAAHFFLPLDFSWIVRRVMKRVHPDALVLCESDFWYHLISQAKSQGASLLLINGKVSERSAKRFQMFRSFSRKLFSPFDHLCVQSERFRDRFAAMGVDPQKITVTGNLKFDATPKTMTPAELETWKGELGIKDKDRVVVIGSSHAPEEEWLLAALDPVWRQIPDLKVLLVPRHPERFAEVATQVKLRGLTICTYSNRQNKIGDERIVLIDAMGLLNTCYQVAEVAIVAGSFIESVGGHNIFEPVLLGVPVLFGPHMHSQLDLEDLVLNSNAGKQVSIDQLPKVLSHLLTDVQAYGAIKQSCQKLAGQVQGSALRTYNMLESRL
ncbi:MAG: 3-deoxy-D-manno-octulosonic acid transferase [Parachlamydiales bacterium]|nr:3-deoxy-D-manno-octulosonic acid transferase [Verrucomicrobiota bacterium]MBX3719862.1 3-deoxy-D-manno-octulosonic acid transferase [Candidatus Acheromyda pituitae]